ncbi:MAG: hypothetical protein JW830_05360 [Bacteroidales bacterium]|nr:hypothetical protein [Bacteroidales bacterium]
MKYTYWLSGVAAFALFLSGCEKNDNPPKETDYSQGIYIVNEGSFQSNNGSISYYDPLEGLIINGIFEAANGRALGDVVQSFATVGDTTGFIVVNGSAKLEVIDLRTFKSIVEPIPVDYPRYFLPVESDRGYLTGGSLGGYIYHIDLKTFEIKDSIEVGKGPENMAQLYDMVFVANSGGWDIDSTIHKIHTLEDRITDTLYVGKAPVDLVFDGSENLWVYCKGQAVYNWDPPYELISETDALMQKIDIWHGNVIWESAVGKAGDYTATPPRIAASADGESIYYLRPDGVYKMDAANPAVPDTPIITGSFYGMDVNPDDGNIYVFEASFTGNGTMKIFNESGTLLSEGTVGIAPNGAVFH